MTHTTSSVDVPAALLPPPPLLMWLYRFDQNTAMSRCSCCNAAAFQRISCEAAAKLVPARVMEVVDEFWQCGRWVTGSYACDMSHAWYIIALVPP